MIRLKPYRTNMNEVVINDEQGRDITILFSYSTPVAYVVNGQTPCVTKQKFSRTTSKHINEWLEAKGFSEYNTVSQRSIESMLDTRV